MAGGAGRVFTRESRRIAVEGGRWLSDSPAVGGEPGEVVDKNRPDDPPTSGTDPDRTGGGPPRPTGSPARAPRRVACSHGRESR